MRTIENEEERRKALKEFYGVYRQLQKENGLRMHSSFSMYDDGLIEIWEYQGDRRTRNVCKIQGESETECYKRATETLKRYAEIIGRKEDNEEICSRSRNGRKAADKVSTSEGRSNSALELYYGQV